MPNTVASIGEYHFIVAEDWNRLQYWVQSILLKNARYITPIHSIQTQRLPLESAPFQDVQNWYQLNSRTQSLPFKRYFLLLLQIIFHYPLWLHSLHQWSTIWALLLVQGSKFRESDDDHQKCIWWLSTRDSLYSWGVNISLQCFFHLAQMLLLTKSSNSLIFFL